MPGLHGSHKQPDWEPCQCEELQEGLPEGVFKETQRHPSWRSLHCMSAGVPILSQLRAVLFSPSPTPGMPWPRTENLVPAPGMLLTKSLSSQQPRGLDPAESHLLKAHLLPEETSIQRLMSISGRTKLWPLASTGQLGRVIPASKLWGQLRPHQDSITAQLYLLPTPPSLFSSASPSSPFPFLFHR